MTFWQRIGCNRQFRALRNILVYEAPIPCDGGHIEKGTIVIELGSWNKQFPNDSMRRLRLPDGREVISDGLNPSDIPGDKWKLI